MPYIILCLEKAVQNKARRRYRGFCPAELAECLGRMAVNDNNKTTVGTFIYMIYAYMHGSFTLC